MKKFCLLLAILLCLSGCSQQAVPSPSASTEGSADSMFVSFDVFAINDLHGRLTDSDTQPGVDELSRYITDIRSQGNVILLATGDMWQGTAEGGLTQGQLITDWMNYMAFDAMTLGGHEYDWGEEGIRANQTQAEFPFLAINIYNHSTGKQADYCQSSLLLEMDGAQVGIIGAIGNCYNAISAGQTQDVYFKTGDELTALVKAEAESLRQQGADFIIYTLHDGFTETFDGVNPIAVEDKDIADYKAYTTCRQVATTAVFPTPVWYWIWFTGSLGS